MARVLVTCVGRRDSGEGGPILEFVTLTARLPKFARWRPDRVYLLSTAEGPGVRGATKPNGDALEARLRNAGTETYHRPMPVRDPTDYGELLQHMTRELRAILRENDRAELLVLVSPGTAQMEAAWFVLQDEGVLPPEATLLQKIAPEFADEEFQIREAGVDALRDRRRLDVARALFGNGSFDQAGRALLELACWTRDDVRASWAEFGERLCEAYHEWDRFRYAEAKQALHKLLEQEVRFARLDPATRELLHQQLAVLDQLTRGSAGYLAQDLYYSAVRRKNEGRWLEAFWRAWLVGEMTIVEAGSGLLRRICGLAPDADLPYKFKEYVELQPEARERLGRFGAQALGLAARIDEDRMPDLIDFVGDHICQGPGHGDHEAIVKQARSLRLAWQQLEPDIAALKQARHQVVHKASVPTEEQVTAALDTARTVLEAFHRQPGQRWPFTHDTTQTVWRLLQDKLANR